MEYWASHWLVLLIFWSPAVTGIRESLHEELVITRLPSQHLAAEFRSQVTRLDTLNNHYDLFPKVLGELLQLYDLEELHMSLTQGIWRHRTWGFPPQPAAPTGAQIWAWFTPNITHLEERWRNVVEALSGHFCASLSRMEPTLTAVPNFSFRPLGLVSGGGLDVARGRYAVSVGENVCTENLTPWKKLLACKERGLSELLNPSALFSSHYSSLAIHIRRVCPDGSKSCRKPGWELTQSVLIVFDVPIFSRLLDWNFRALFGHPIGRFCALADSESIFVELEPNQSIKPPPEEILERFGRKFARFDLKKAERGLNIAATFGTTRLSLLNKERPLLWTESFLEGTGQQNGQLVTRLGNRDISPIKLVYSHLIPWFLRVYLHTVVVRCDSETIKPLFLHFSPARDRSRPTYLEMALELPPECICRVSMDFDKLLLRWTEYPPDAHRGFPVPGPVITFRASSRANQTLPLGAWMLFSKFLNETETEAEEVVRLFGETMLVILPTPDFSMPYNVICLVCTVVALAFGPIHNLTTRSLIPKNKEELQKKSLRGKLKGLKESLKKKLLGRFFRTKQHQE